MRNKTKAKAHAKRMRYRANRKARNGMMLISELRERELQSFLRWSRPVGRA